MVKVKVAVGVGKIARKAGTSNSMDDAKLKKISNNLATITGQKPRTHLSKKAISNFKLRTGMPIGLSVTLRKKAMFDFISRLVNIALPRVRDFRGLNPKSFDGNGNFSLGLNDYSVFPEVQPEDVESVHGVEITIVTTAKNDHEGLELLTALGFPLQKPTVKKKEEPKIEMSDEVKAEIAKVEAEQKKATEAATAKHATADATSADKKDEPKK